MKVETQKQEAKKKGLGIYMLYMVLKSLRSFCREPYNTGHGAYSMSVISMLTCLQHLSYCGVINVLSYTINPPNVQQPRIVT